MTQLRQVPAPVDLWCVAGDPIEWTLTIAGDPSSISDPEWTLLRSVGGSAVTGVSSVPSVAGLVASFGLTATETAALKALGPAAAATTLVHSFALALDGASDTKEIIAGKLVVLPVGSSVPVSASSTELTVNIGDQSITVTVSLGGDPAAAVAAHVAAADPHPGYVLESVPIQPGWTSGQLYCPKGGSTSTRSFADGDLYLVPFVVRSAASFDRIRIDITTNGTGSTVFRLGIWEHDSTTGRPGTLNLDAGTVSGTSVAVVTASIALTFSTPCLVWLGAAAQSVTGSPVLRGIVAGNGGGQGVVFDNTNGSGGGMNTYKYSGVTGAFSDLTATTPTATNSAPIIWLKAA